MPRRSNYYRSFIMLTEEDRGFGKTGKPTGYLKLEAKENAAKILVHVQNIRLLGDNNSLKAYLLSSKNPEMQPLDIGTIILKGSDGDAVYQVSEKEFKKMNVALSDLDTVIVVCTNTTSDNKALLVPLVGFKNHSWEWKNKFTVSTRNNTTDQDTVSLCSDQTRDEEIVEEINESVPGVQEKTTEIVQHEDERTDDIPIQPNEGMELEEHKEKIVTPEIKKQEKDLPQTENGAQGIVDTQIHMRKHEDNNMTNAQQELLLQLKKYIKTEEPFANGKPGYQWWAINNCKFIVDHAYSNYNIIALLYNLQVMNILHRYGHYLFGIKQNDQQAITYICYAIPARYGLDPHPLLRAQAYATWVPRRGEKITIGAFGYWIIKMDAARGEFIYNNEDR